LIDLTQLMTLPHAHGGPAGNARVRAQPEDFVVREWLGFEPDGEGDHLLLQVRKRNANTMWVAKQLAGIARIHARDVGFAGLKDRDAITEQAFTVPARSAIGQADIRQWLEVSGEGFEVIAVDRQRRKLKRGALRGNRFEIVLRDFTGDPARLEHNLQAIATEGIPNYFGPQRFGRSGSNLKLAQAWFSGAQPPRDRAQRGFALSAARAAIFNAVLAQRVSDGTWNTLQDGEVANLNGSGSIFAVPVVDEALRERCRTLDIHPSGPLWGVTSVVDGAASAPAALEQQIAERYAVLAEGLVGAGLEAERRALRTPVTELSWTISASDVHLGFRLQRGSFATAVLHELIDNVYTAQLPEAGD
jgi:tRNA pseudouridine13 synthase